jgi:V/A-type H+-transporting ATPase subunit E
MENLKSQLKFLQEIEVKEIIESAEEQARKILKEAEGEAEKIRNQKMEEVSEKLQERQSAEMAMAKLEGKKKISSVKFQLFEEALAKASEKLREISTGENPIYKESLERLIVEAATKLNEKDLEILTSSNDKNLVKEKLRGLEKKISRIRGSQVSLQITNEPLTALGGVIVRTKDKRKIFNNTLDARLAKLKQELVDKVFASLFEGVED